MSPLLRIAAAMLFVTVLVAQPEPVEAHPSCSVYTYYEVWTIYQCTSGCEDVYNGWTGPCYPIYCYESEGSTWVYEQCF
jgi:hypothetical protein